MALTDNAMSSIDKIKYRRGPAFRDKSKPHKRFCIPHYYLYRTDRFPGRKWGTAVAVGKEVLHTNIDLATLVSVEAAGSALRLETMKSPLHLFANLQNVFGGDADIELLGVRNKAVLASDLNVKKPF